MAQASASDDNQLLARIKEGNADAFAVLYGRYCDRACRVARSVCDDAGQVEDAVQEAFLSVWKCRDSYRPQATGAAAWVLTVARHRAIDAARINARIASRQTSADALELCPAEVDVAGEAIARAEAARLRRRLAALPERQREAIVLAYFGQLSHAEISLRLGIPPGTVKGRLRLGIAKLRAPTGL